MIDWFLEICYSYELDWESFWFAVELLDSLIADFKFVHTDNIHLVGMVCCFISAKMKGTTSLRLRHLIVVLGSCKYTST